MYTVMGHNLTIFAIKSNTSEMLSDMRKFLRIGMILSVIYLIVMIFFAFSADVKFSVEGLTNSAIYKVFPLHLACAINSYLMIIISAIAGVFVLLKRWKYAESVHSAGIELSLIYILFVIISGMMWAKISWGTYWNWEPRLTASAIYLFLLLALMILRNLSKINEQARISTIFTFIVLLNIPFIHFATRWFGKTLHPESGTMSIPGYSDIKQIAWFTVLALFIFSCTLLCFRVKLLYLRNQKQIK